ncbi:MAG: ribose 5-phosphate isomerase B [Chloroflexi bacterium]|nr:ribose 5-phosphate isomerase B [Chloroflexota bacterium]
MNKNILIVLGSDHAGYELKLAVLKFLEEMGYDVTDVGAHSSEESVDYPVFAKSVAEKVASGKFKFGMLFCGTGIGMSIAANKVKRIRAAACSDPVTASFARRHNDANILCMGGRITTPTIGIAIAEAFLKAEFEAGRHARRVEEIFKIEHPE